MSIRIIFWASLCAVGFAAVARGQQPEANTIVGRVTDLTGKPIAGAKVFVWEATERAPLTVATTAENDGSFRLGPGPAKPSNDLFVEAEGFARLRVASVPSYSRCAADVGTLALESGTRLRGRVTDELGKPLPAVPIEILTWLQVTSGCISQDGPLRSLRSDVDGSFTTPALGPGDHRLCFAVEGRIRVECQQSLAPGDGGRDLGTIALVPDTPIRGRVVGPGGKPVTGAQVYCDYDYAHAAKTDADGRFELRGHPAAAKQVWASASGFVRGQWALPADHTKVTIELQAAHQIRGRVVDAATGAPVRIGEVWVSHVVRHLDGGIDFLEHASDDWEQPETGRFCIHYDESGELQITATAGGYRPGELLLPSMAAPLDLEDIVVRLNRADSAAATDAAAKVRGKVAIDGRPCTEGWASICYPKPEADTLNVELCRCCPVPQGASAYCEVELDIDGTFTFDHVLPAARALLVIAVPGRAPHVQKLSLAVGARPMLDIALQPGAAIRGRVTGVPEAMRGRLFVVAFDQYVVRRDVRIAVDGSFAVTNLPPGSYGLRVGHDDAELLAEAWPEVYGDESNEEEARPWAGVELLHVKAGQTLTGVTVPYVQAPKAR